MFENNKSSSKYSYICEITTVKEDDYYMPRISAIKITKKEKTGQMNQWSRESKLAFVKDAVRHFLNHQNHVAETGELKPKENEIKSIL